MSGMFPENQVIEIFGEQLLWPGVGPNGKFTNGSFSDPLIKPSFIPAETINLIVDNLQNVIADAGLTPNNIEPDQLVKALRAMFQKDDKFVNNLYSRYDLLEDFPVAASTENVNISVGGELEIDGISCTVGQLVFLKDQTDKRENGFWEVRSGEWRRHAEYTSTTPYAFTGKFILVKDGIANKGKVYYLLDDISVIGTTPLDFKENKLFSLLLKIFGSNPVEEIHVIPGAETPDIHWSRMGSPDAFDAFMRGFLRPHSGAAFDPSYADGPAHGKVNIAFMGGVLLPDGRVLLVPYNSPNVGIVRLCGLDVGIGYCLHPYLNKF